MSIGETGLRMTVFKDDEDAAIQYLIITTNNVNYRREVYYLASTNKSYRGELRQKSGKRRIWPWHTSVDTDFKSRGQYVGKADFRLFSKLWH